MAEEILSFDEHRRRKEDAGTVRCARCGKQILATVIRCPECGVHFGGEAQDFTHPTERIVRRSPTWVLIAATLVVAALLLGTILR